MNFEMRFLRLSTSMTITLCLLLSLYVVVINDVAADRQLGFENTNDGPVIHPYALNASIPMSLSNMADSSRIYYRDLEFGAKITLTLEMSGTPPFLLAGTSLFGDDTDGSTYESSDVPAYADITYIVVSTDSVSSTTLYTLTDGTSTQANAVVLSVLDESEPVVEISTDIISKTGLIEGTASDYGGSGVSSVRVLTNTEAVDWVLAEDAKNWSLQTNWPSEDGMPYTITAKASDYLSSTKVVTKTVLLDNTAPLTESVRITTSVPVTSDYPIEVIIEWNGFQDGSGAIDSYLYGVDLSHLPLPKAELKMVTHSKIVTEHVTGGDWYFHLSACDRAGNCSMTLVEEIATGQEPPVYLPMIHAQKLTPTPTPTPTPTITPTPTPTPLWQQANNTGGNRFFAPIECNQTWYAGTSEDGVWKSAGNLDNWSRFGLEDKESTYPITVVPSSCTRTFVATWGDGVYQVNGTTFDPLNNGLTDLFLYGLVIDEDETNLYAGTNSSGVFKKPLQNNASGAWQRVDGLPSIRIRSLYYNDGLWVGSRACTLYEPDGATWKSSIIIPDSASCDDAQVWSILRVDDKLFAGLGGGKGLYLRVGNGDWKAIQGNPGPLTIWGLAHDKQYGYLYVSAYGEDGVYRCMLREDDSPLVCDPYGQGITVESKQMRQITISNGMVVVGSNDGIWYRPVLP